MLRFSLFFVCLLLLACERETEYVHYPDGSIKSEIPKKDNLNHGIAKGYFENGKLKYEESWVYGELNGMVKYYYENGSVKEETQWKNSRREGLSRLYDENSRLWFKAHYLGGRKTYSELYYPDGKVLEKKLYNENEDMIYLVEFDPLGAKKLESPVPIIQAENDTIILGEEYQITISFGMELKGDLSIYTGKLDSLNRAVELKTLNRLANNKFYYSFIPTETGTCSLPLFFKHSTEDNDSLNLDGFRYRKTYYVKPLDAPLI